MPTHSQFAKVFNRLSGKFASLSETFCPLKQIPL